MPAPTYVPKVAIWEDTSCFLAARVKGNSGANITQGTISSASLKVFDVNNSYAQVYSTSLVVADVVFNTLQTDARWLADSKGYNLGVTIPASAFAAAGVYQVEVSLTPTVGDKLLVVGEVTVRESHSS